MCRKLPLLIGRDTEYNYSSSSVNICIMCPKCMEVCSTQLKLINPNNSNRNKLKKGMVDQIHTVKQHS